MTQERDRTRLIVFAGAGLSGKTTLSTAIAADYPESLRLEMDALRLQRLPDSEHNKSDRSVAYRMVHSEAEKGLREKRSTILLVASYASRDQREAVVDLAKKYSANIFLVECRVSPEDAVERFRKRLHSAGIDLNSGRVREFADSYPVYGGGCTVDTSGNPIETNVAKIRDYLKKGTPLWNPEEWSREGSKDQVMVAQQVSTSAEPETKLSPVSRRQARFRIVGYVIVFLLAAVIYGYGMVDLFLGYLRNSDSLFAQATAIMTAGLFVLAIPPVYTFLEKPLKESFGILRLGREATYANVKEVRRSNRELYRDYIERTSGSSPQKGFLIDGIPVYFLIRPEKGKSFDVIVDPPASDVDKESERFQKRLRDEAAGQGFDWTGYRKWRIGVKASEYFGPRISEKSLRALDVSQPANDAVSVKGAPIQYAEYLAIEQSVNLVSVGQIPYMREFFEGEDWWRKTVDLDSVPNASQRYSMMLGVTGVVITKDNYVVLQRRSAQVQSGQGGLTAGASGGVEWRDATGKAWTFEGVVPNFRRKEDRFSLRNSLMREIREELGLLEGDFEKDSKPFIGAAFNLKYGRDLNFYAYLKCKLTRDEVSKVFNEGRTFGFVRSAGRDRWEVANLIFIPLEWLRLDDAAHVTRREEVLGDARHARAAITAFRIYEGWQVP